VIKLSDYVIDSLAKRGIRDIFMVSGGGIMHLVDSVGKHPDMRYTCNYHEQSCAIAAETYARVTNHIGACLVTTGPGSTNALSGVVGAWVDSIPLIVISGQVRRDLIADYKKIRQLGPQEINIMDMARPVTKYITTVMDPGCIRYELEYAIARAMEGRPGPVWINIPLDVQAAMVEEDLLLGCPVENKDPDPSIDLAIGKVIGLLQRAKRPVLVCGNGIHLARAEELLEKFICKTRIPVLFTIAGMDLLDENNEFNQGRFGPIGQRRANFALQNADLLISLGASLSMASTGFNVSSFAPKATKVMVDVDPGELSKPTYRPDIPISCDVGHFLTVVLDRLEYVPVQGHLKWEEACKNWKKKYPICVPEYYANLDFVNTYAFADILSELLSPEDVVITGNSLDICSVYQTFRVKKGQRVITNSNYGAMGWDLPGAVGACIGRDNKRTILFTGDGSLQFNVHELLTVGFNCLNIKIFVVNNLGYDSIRATQNNYFNGQYTGADASSGVGNPDYAMLAAAYGLRYEKILTNDQVREKTAALLEWKGPTLCELNVSPAQGRSPKTSSYRREDGTLESRPLEDMYPFLPREEVWQNMHLFDNESGG
jgi:acetolactate synthase I/II/III large subunit